MVYEKKGDKGKRVKEGGRGGVLKLDCLAGRQGKGSENEGREGGR